MPGIAPVAGWLKVSKVDNGDEVLEAVRLYGEELGTEVEGRSSVVMRSVLEAVEWVLPALLRIFTASDQICVVEPRLPGQEEQAEIATAFLNHIWYRDNDGFSILHDWQKDALLEKVGWLKVWFDTSRECVTKSYSHITEEEFEALLREVPPANPYLVARWRELGIAVPGSVGDDADGPRAEAPDGGTSEWGVG